MELDALMEILNAEQPDYNRGRELKQRDLEFLGGLLDEGDENLAAKAVALASRSLHVRKNEIILQAAQHPSITIRLAAAGACKNLDDKPRNLVLLQLLSDKDGGIRKTALESARGKVASGSLRAGIHLRCRMETDPTMIRLAERVYSSLMAQ